MKSAKFTELRPAGRLAFIVRLIGRKCRFANGQIWYQWRNLIAEVD